MLTNLSNLRILQDTEVLRFEPVPGLTEIRFAPVREWEQGEDGKNRPTGRQVRLGGAPLWQAFARVADFKYGQPIWRDETIFVASETQPALDTEVAL